MSGTAGRTKISFTKTQATGKREEESLTSKLRLSLPSPSSSSVDDLGLDRIDGREEELVVDVSVLVDLLGGGLF